jgi:hypothetical protein
MARGASQEIDFGGQVKNPPLMQRTGSSDHLSNARLLAPEPAAKATNLRKFEKNTLRAFFDLTLASGLVLCGCTLHFREHWWVGFPARPYKDQAGNETWAKFVDFASKSARDRFQDIATEAALSAYEAGQ